MGPGAETSLTAATDVSAIGHDRRREQALGNQCVPAWNPDHETQTIQRVDQCGRSVVSAYTEADGAEVERNSGC